jgi:nucleotidyltransferase/DNA polymerase involved in DNA repair
LVKGRIAETLFEQMLRDAGCFTILAFGYENVLPELARRQQDMQTEETMEIIRHTPDFAVINNKTHEVHLIEVKFMKNQRVEWILRDARRMYESWKPSYLFLATPNGFFFDKASKIVEREGIIDKFSHPEISIELQENYTRLLNEFIPLNAE